MATATLRTATTVASCPDGAATAGLFQQLENRGASPLTVHSLTFGFYLPSGGSTASVYVRTAPGAEHRPGYRDPSG